MFILSWALTGLSVNLLQKSVYAPLIMFNFTEIYEQTYRRKEKNNIFKYSCFPNKIFEVQKFTIYPFRSD